jgi:hypothetical protein
MSATREFYLAQAEKCAKEAAEARLDNVRERCERSERSWRAMADQLERTEIMRDRRAAEKAAEAEVAA